MRARAGLVGRAGAGVAVLLALAGCSSAETRPTPECHMADFLGDWVNARRTDEGITVGAKSVTVIAGPNRTTVRYVAKRDFGPVTRQVLRQEFGNLTTLGVLPATQTELGLMHCALHLIRPHGAAALVIDRNNGLVFLEETDGADPPATMRLRRGEPRPIPAPSLMDAPT